MAYCVKCGVKLEPGTISCPLCKTEVRASEEIIGKSTKTLFGSSHHDHREEQPLVDMRRKGFIELILALATIAIIILAITGWAIGPEHPFSPWFSIGCVFIGVGFILAPLVLPSCYVLLSSTYVLLTLAILLFIDAQIGGLSWSLYTTASLVLYWLIGVFPWVIKHKRLVLGIVVDVVSIGLYLFLLDIFDGPAVTWFFPVALPIYVVTLICAMIFGLRMRRGMTVSEIVMGLILIACIAVGVGDIFYLRFIDHPDFVSWSLELWIIAGLLALYLIAVATIKKVRLFFTNKIDK